MATTRLVRIVLIFGLWLAATSALSQAKSVMVDIRVDSQNPGYEGYRAMDGNPASMWHTDWQFRQTGHPHQITVDLGATYELSGIAYLPRSGGGNGTILDYECYVSDHPAEFEGPVIAGTFERRDGENVIQFPANVHGRYVRLRALSEVAGRPWTSIAELRILAEGVQFRAKPSAGFHLTHPDGTPLDELEIQFAALVNDLRNRAHFAKMEHQVHHPQALVWESDRDPVDEATVAVIDVYNGLKPWPENTDIRALRVIQILPMTVPSGRPPHEVGLRMPSAKDSVVLARYVLGTVPVEADGSAHFTVPAHKEIFFQALDDRGLAVQSMRSATYLQSGERLVCHGCHEPNRQTPQILQHVPLALRRPPSQLKPDVDGSNPFSYAQLVQPVLDRHCVDCHAEKADEAPNLAREPIQRNWYASYVSLATDYGYWSYGNGHRTTPGQFGARASKLLEILDEGHYEIELPEEDYHRIALWLDCCSIFYGVYEKQGGEAQLRGEIVWPTLQ